MKDFMFVLTDEVTRIVSSRRINHKYHNKQEHFYFGRNGGSVIIDVEEQTVDRVILESEYARRKNR